MELKTDRQIASCKVLGEHSVGIPNTILEIRQLKNGSIDKRWRCKAFINGKRKKFQLGRYPEMSKRQARDARDKIFVDLKSGIHPNVEKAKAVQKVVEQQQQLEGKPTLFEVTCEYIKNVKVLEWKQGSKSQQQWESSLERYVLGRAINPNASWNRVNNRPKVYMLNNPLADTPIDEITVDDVVEKVEPIWVTKHDTADRVLNRLKHIFNYAIAKKHSNKANPADYNVLQYLLPNIDYKAQHFAALPYDDLNKFWVDLQTRRGDQNFDSHDFIAMVMLTAQRQMDVRKMMWDQVDIDNGHWWAVVHKASTDEIIATHKVPLPSLALAILKRRIQDPALSSNKYVFPGGGANGFISEASGRKLLKQMDYRDDSGNIITMHGFRSCLMDCVREYDLEDWKIADQQLAHEHGDKVFKAYARGGVYRRRQALMQQYSDFIEGKVTPEALIKKFEDAA